MMKEKKRAICGICSAGCWVEITFDGDGRIDEVEADGSSPLGMVCPMGRRSRQIVYSENRIRTPLLRRGPKGAFDFAPVGWDEAYERIVEKLQAVKAAYGPEAAAVYTGSGSFELAFCDVFQPRGVAVSSAASVLFPYGSPNTLGVGALCYVSFAMIAPHVTMGRMFIDMYPDIEHAGLIVVWGKNPAAHCPPHDFLRIEEARRRGAKVIVIDPRRTALAKEGGEWVPVRPGSDGALALSMCSVLIEEELYDEDFAANWTTGFDDFARLVQHYRPEAAADITGVPADTIRRLARTIAGADGAAPVMYSGLEYSDGAVQAIRAVMVFWALAGQLDVPGGQCLAMGGGRFPMNREGHIENPDVRRAAGHNDFPVYTKYRGEFHAGILPAAVLRDDPYPIRLLISLGASIISSWPQSEIWKRTLGGLDFLVTVDRQLTADAAYADIVLPASTYYEMESYMVYGPLFRVRERVIEPVGEARPDYFIFAELARRLGYGGLYPQTPEDLLRHALKASPFSLEEVRAAGGSVQVPSAMMEYRKWEKGLLRPDGGAGFDTPTGKFEIASTILEENGYDALPVYTEPGESPLSAPETAREFPLVFNSGARAKNDLHGLHLSVPDISKERPVPTVLLNDEDAAARGIGDGDKVRLSTVRGSVELIARVTGDIVAGAVEASAMGGGPLGPVEWQKANINELTDLKRYDPISGFPVYKALLCQVERIGVATAAPSIEEAEYRPAPAGGAVPTARSVYFDNNATTAVDKTVAEAVAAALDFFGNPSGLYGRGKEARHLLDKARRSVALLLGTTARRIVFTGGGSEANNLAIKGAALKLPPERRSIVTSAIEHPSVLETCRWLAGQGFEVTFLPADEAGLVAPSALAAALTEQTGLVTVMLANNETGAIQPVAELAGLAHGAGALFHTDAVQAAGKTALDVAELGVDMLTISGHKFHGPKGVGALYVARGTELQPLIHGGGQERGLRAGTENVPGIAGMGRSAELALGALSAMEDVEEIRDRLEAGISEIIPGARLNGPRSRRLPNTLNMTLPGIRGESLVLLLDQRGIAVSAGSACHAGEPEPSHALKAMGLSDEEAHCAVRISLSRDNSPEDAAYFLAILKETVSARGARIRFVSCR